MSCRSFHRSSSRLVPASNAQSHGVGLQTGCRNRGQMPGADVQPTRSRFGENVSNNLFHVHRSTRIGVSPYCR
jgi:hypothetical protein